MDNVIDESIVEYLGNRKTPEFMSIFKETLAYLSISDNDTKDYPLSLLSDEGEISEMELADAIIDYYKDRCFANLELQGIFVDANIDWIGLWSVGLGLNNILQSEKSEIEETMGDLGKTLDGFCSILGIANPDMDADDYLLLINDVTGSAWDWLEDELLKPLPVDTSYMSDIEDEIYKQERVGIMRNFISFLNEGADTMPAINMIKNKGVKLHLKVATYMAMLRFELTDNLLEPTKPQDYNRAMANILILLMVSDDVAIEDIWMKAEEIALDFYGSVRTPFARHALRGIQNEYIKYCREHP